ncbi:hypothetical protein ACFLV4_07970 [Chloroflexota bacterium]
MNAYSKGVVITFGIAAIVSLIVTIALWNFKDTEYKDVALLWSLASIAIVFLVFAIYMAIGAWKKSWWLPGLPGSVVVYFGAIIFSISQYVGNIVNEIGMDPSIAGFGITVVAIGLAIVPREESRSLDRDLAELTERISELGSKIDALDQTYNKLDNLVSSVSDESQKFIDSLSQRLKNSG